MNLFAGTTDTTDVSMWLGYWWGVCYSRTVAALDDDRAGFGSRDHCVHAAALDAVYRLMDTLSEGVRPAGRAGK